IPFLQDTVYTYRAVAALNRYAAFQRARAAGPGGRLTAAPVRAKARAYLEGLWAQPGRAGTALTEREGKGLLALYGIPTTREALAMVDRLRGRRILDGLRGAPPADVAAAVDAIQRLSELAGDVGDLVEEIDVNPLLVLPTGAVALDCLVVPAT